MNAREELANKQTSCCVQNAPVGRLLPSQQSAPEFRPLLAHDTLLVSRAPGALGRKEAARPKEGEKRGFCILQLGLALASRAGKLLKTSE